jgi:hypothetical protein
MPWSGAELQLHTFLTSAAKGSEFITPMKLRSDLHNEKAPTEKFSPAFPYFLSFRPKKKILSTLLKQSQSMIFPQSDRQSFTLTQNEKVVLQKHLLTLSSNKTPLNFSQEIWSYSDHLQYKLRRNMWFSCLVTFHLRWNWSQQKIFH